MRFIPENEENLILIGRKLKFLRNKTGLTLDMIGKLAGFSGKTISNWEHGRRPVNEGFNDYLQWLSRFTFVNIATLENPNLELEFYNVAILPDELYRILIFSNIQPKEKKAGLAAMLAPSKELTVPPKEPTP